MRGFCAGPAGVASIGCFVDSYRTLAGLPDRVQRVELDLAPFGGADAETGDRERALFERIEAERFFDVDLVDRGRDECGEAELCRGEIHRLREMADVEDQRAIGLRVIPVFPEIADEPARRNHHHLRVDEIRLRRDKATCQRCGFDGGQRADRLERMIDRSGPVKLIAVTGVTGGDYDERIAHAGFDARFAKPADLSDLLGAMTAAGAA